MNPYRRLRWMEWRWWAALRRARAAGAIAVSLGVYRETSRDDRWKPLTEIAGDLGLTLIEQQTADGHAALVGPL